MGSRGDLRVRKQWKVTKSIRGIGVRFFGRTFCLTVPMVIEREPGDDLNSDQFRESNP